MIGHKVLVRENLQCLQQAIDMLNNISDDVYANNDGPNFSSGVGRHIRHIIDFYDSFLKGHDSGIDYDARQRDPRMEGDRQYGMGKIRRIMDALDEMPVPAVESEKHLSVKSDAAGPETTAFCVSTLNRELQFVKFHAIHHYAMIAMILKIQQVEPPEDFGYAPSTLQYVKQSGS